MTRKLSWLHLSDIHFLPRTSWKSVPARSLLLERLRRIKSDGQISSPDVIFCTGDIAYGEAARAPMAQQYAQAREFFDQLLAIYGLAKERLVIVPGNHDVNRQKINPDAQRTLNGYAKESRTHAEKINQRFEDLDLAQKDALRRLDDYRDFVTTYLPDAVTDDTRLLCVKTIEISGVRTGIVGLNSAWSCSGDEDDRQLWLAAHWQLNLAELGLTDSRIRIALMHHPVDWLNEAERDLLARRLEEKYHFFLHGHSHNQWLDAGQHCVKIAAGALGADKQGEFGFNLVTLDLESHRGEMHAWGFSPESNAWREMHLPNQVGPGFGVFSFQSDRTVPGKPVSVAPALKGTNVSAPEAAHQVSTTASPPHVAQAAPASAEKKATVRLYGRDQLVARASEVLHAGSLLILYGMRGNGKSRLIDALLAGQSWTRSGPPIHLLASPTHEPADILRQLSGRLGITDDNPQVPDGDAESVAEQILNRSTALTPTVVWVDRAHLWFGETGWRNPSLAGLVTGLRKATSNNWHWILELRERPPEGLFPRDSILEVPGLSRSALSEWIADSAPSADAADWQLSGDRLTALYQWLGGGHGQQAHPLAISLLIELARGLNVTPYDIRQRFLDQAEEKLERFLISDLFENVLSTSERQLLLAIGLYRGYIPHDHAEPLEHALKAEGAWRGLDRRCLLAADGNQERFYLHGFISGWLRQRLGYATDQLTEAELTATEPAKDPKARALHAKVADCWLAQVRGRHHLTPINIERALEAFHHLVASGNELKVREIAIELVAAHREGASSRLWLLCNSLYKSNADDAQLVSVLRLILAIEPHDHKALRFLGESLQRIHGRGHVEALECFRHAVRIRPGFPPYLADLGVALLAQGADGAQEFLKIVERARSENPQAINDFVLAVELDCLQLVEPTTGSASRRRQELIRLGTRHSAFFAAEAEWLVSANDLSGALSILQTAHERRCTDGVLTALHARVLHAQGRDDEASVVRQAAIAARTSEPTIYLNEARWQLARRNYGACRVALDGMTEIGLENDEAIEIRAAVLDATGKGMAASTLRQGPISRRTRVLGIYHAEALWLLGSKQAPAGLKLLNIPDELGIADEHTESIRASLLDAAGDKHGASALRLERIASGSSNPAFYTAEAIQKLETGDSDGAISLLEQAEARGLGNEHVWFVRARALAAAGRNEEASSVRTHVIESGSKYTPVYLAEANWQFSCGRYETVLAIIDTASKRSCSNRELEELRRRATDQLGRK